MKLHCDEIQNRKSKMQNDVIDNFFSEIECQKN